MRTPSSTLQHHITTLSDAYHQLSPFWKFFYPRAVSQAIVAGNPFNIAQTAVNNTWFFQRWFFSSLNTFLSAAPVRSAQFILKNQACLDALSSTTTPLAVIEAMLHYKATTRLNASRVCRDIVSIFSNTHAHVREQILLLLDRLGLFNTTASQAQNNLREASTAAPEVLLSILTSLEEDFKRTPSMTQAAIQTEFSRLRREANATIQAEEKAQRANQAQQRRQTAGQTLVNYVLSNNLLALIASDQQNSSFEALYDHPSPEALLPLLRFLNTQGLLRHDPSDRLIRIIHHPHPVNLLTGLNTLSSRGLLQAHFNSILGAENPSTYIQSLNPRDDTLRNIANDSESSMRALTSPEQQGMSKLLSHYRGKSSLSIDTVKAALRARYRAQPAFITRSNGTRINLPLEITSFDSLSLSTEERQRAFEQYYQHKTHTALRYLMQPNPWNGRSAALSTIQLQNIAIFWQAVSDETTPAVGGYTLEGRIDAFIMGLADLGRAHNWDRTKINSKTGKYEQYDDLEHDKPTCGGGIDTRLYRTIQGHPLTQGGLTLEIVDQELNDFVRVHFNTTIRALDATAKDQLYEDIVEYVCDVAGASDDLKASIATLNISTEGQQRFLTFMSNKYRETFTTPFRNHVSGQFKFIKEFPSHFLRFQNRTNIMSVFDETTSPTP
ncbi:MAG: hypothetical protein ACOYKA_02815 [Legionellaceae bacterium]